MTEKDTYTIGKEMLQVLDERGWHQGHLYDTSQPPETAPVCLAGAIHCVVFGVPDPQPYGKGSTEGGWAGGGDTFVSQIAFAQWIWKRLQVELSKDASPQEYIAPSWFNDQPTTTEEDVRLLIKRALMSDDG